MTVTQYEVVLTESDRDGQLIDEQLIATHRTKAAALEHAGQAAAIWGTIIRTYAVRRIELTSTTGAIR